MTKNEFEYEVMKMDWQDENDNASVSTAATKISCDLETARSMNFLGVDALVRAIRSCVNAGRFTAAEKMIFAGLELKSLNQSEINELQFAKGWLAAQVEDSNELKSVISFLSAKKSNTVNQSHLNLLKSRYAFLLIDFANAEKFARLSLPQNLETVDRSLCGVDELLALGTALLAQKKYLLAEAPFFCAMRSTEMWKVKWRASLVGSFLALCYANTGHKDHANYIMHQVLREAECGKSDLLTVAQTNFNASLLSNCDLSEREKLLEKASASLKALSITKTTLAKTVDAEVQNLKSH